MGRDERFAPSAEVVAQRSGGKLESLAPTRRLKRRHPPTLQTGTSAANDVTRDAQARQYERSPSSPATTRRSSANAPRRAGASQRVVALNERNALHWRRERCAAHRRTRHITDAS